MSLQARLIQLIEERNHSETYFNQLRIRLILLENITRGKNFLFPVEAGFINLDGEVIDIKILPSPLEELKKLGFSPEIETITRDLNFIQDDHQWVIVEDHNIPFDFLVLLVDRISPYLKEEKVVTWTFYQVKASSVT